MWPRGVRAANAKVIVGEHVAHELGFRPVVDERAGAPCAAQHAVDDFDVRVRDLDSVRCRSEPVQRQPLQLGITASGNSAHDAARRGDYGGTVGPGRADYHDRLVQYQIREARAREHEKHGSLCRRLDPFLHLVEWIRGRTVLISGGAAIYEDRSSGRGDAGHSGTRLAPKPTCVHGPDRIPVDRVVHRRGVVEMREHRCSQ